MKFFASAFFINKMNDMCMHVYSLFFELVHVHTELMVSLFIRCTMRCVVSSYKESRNNKPIYGYMLPNLSPSPNLYKVQSVYNNNVAS